MAQHASAPPEDSALPGAGCVERLKLLADPTRLAIMRLLTGGPMLVKEINAALDLEQNLLSFHLRVLREGGLVTAERRGKGVAYRLADGVYDPDRGDSIDLGCCRLSFDALQDT